MKTVVTKGIVLQRTNFGEADRIVTILSPDSGKIRLIAKGTRKQGSKLAGALELFSISDISYIPGRGEMHTMVSGRIDKHFGNIVNSVERTMFGYELLKRVNRHTEDLAESEYFELLANGLDALNIAEVRLDDMEAWLKARLLKLSGKDMNLSHDIHGKPLSATQNYNFDLDKMALSPNDDGTYNSGHIKVLRLLHGLDHPLALTKIEGARQHISEVARLLEAVTNEYT